VASLIDSVESHRLQNVGASHDHINENIDQLIRDWANKMGS